MMFVKLLSTFVFVYLASCCSSSGGRVDVSSAWGEVQQRLVPDKSSDSYLTVGWISERLDSVMDQIHQRFSDLTLETERNYFLSVSAYFTIVGIGAIAYLIKHLVYSKLKKRRQEIDGVGNMVSNMMDIRRASGIYIA